ncbi:protein-glutamate O-methyltransferase CheR [soil metagenome]
MTDQDFEYVCRLVRDRSAIVLEAGKEYLVQARLLPVAKKLNLGSVADLVAKLRSNHDDALKARVVEAMATTETLFFRDHHPFETLKTVVLPELIRKREKERRLEIWCAACSTGQEPYSLAILLREHFPQLAGWQIRIRATDLSGEVLAKAREASYSQIEVNRGLPAPLLLKYFRQEGANWKLRDDIRTAVDFREMNLIKPWPLLPRMDLIFIRNVLIYFDLETKKSILSRCSGLLRPDGYLLLGGAETTINLESTLRRVAELKGGFFQLSN